MHYLAFVFVDQPTNEAVRDAMGGSMDDEWDWYRCGGRWDGHLLGEEEEKRRETDGGFNFGDQHNDAARNSCKVSDLPADRIPYAFVSDGDYVPKKYYNKYEKSDPAKDYFGAILPTPYWQERYSAALAEYSDKFVVVVDVHN